MPKFRTSLILVALSLAFLSSAVKAEWKTYGDFSRIVEQFASGVVIETTTGSRIRVEFDGPTSIRFRYANSGKFEDFPSYAVQKGRKAAAAVSAGDSLILANSNGFAVRIFKSPVRIVVYDGRETVLAEDQANRASFNDETGESKISFLRRGEVETYYGFGEKAFAGMSRHNEYIVNWNTDTYAYPQGLDPIYQSIPFFYALRDGKAYGVYLNNTFRTFFDMGKTSPERYSFGTDGGELDFFVFTGGKERSPKRVLEDYSDLTGRGPLPPLWSLGNQQSRWSYSPESRVREIAAKYRGLRIPLDVIYLDIDYMDGYRVFTWNSERFPDPKKLISDLAAEGIRTVLIIDPGVKVDPDYSVYKDGKAKGVFVKNPDGSEFNSPVWAGASAFPDFMDPKARQWFSSNYRKHLDEGVAGFWNDMNEPATFMTERTDPPRIYHHPDKTFPYDTPQGVGEYRDDQRRYHNLYGMQMARSSFEGLQKLEPGKRPFVLTRAGFSGIQRYSAVWTGDNIASWEHLQLSIPMLANLSVSGVPFIGADVGGFSGVPSGELYARWLQAAALTPFLRSHSETGVANKEPWEYGERFVSINRTLVELRYRLLPYLYSLFRHHEKNGMPVLAPIWFEYPDDTETYLLADQYLVGRDLLVAPVVRENQTKRRVYFPKGDDWRDFDTGELYSGGTWAEILAPLDKLPLFARVGAVIPIQPVIQHTGEMNDAPLTLLVIAGIGESEVEKTYVFQDRGDGYGYRSDDHRTISIEHRRGILRLTRSGGFRTPQRIRFVEALGVSSKPAEVRVDGVPVEANFDPRRSRLRIAIGDSASEVTLRR